MLALTDHERVVKRKLVKANRLKKDKQQVGDQAFQKTLKPFIKPLTEVVSIVKAQKPKPLKQITQKAEPVVKQIALNGEPVVKRTIEAQREPLDKQKLEEYISKNVKREETMKLMRGGDIIAQYDITPELLNVLFTNNVSEKTKKTYAQILNVTNAIRKKYDGNSGIQGTRLQKYSTFIKLTLEEYNLLITTIPTPSRSVRKGEGINKYITPQVDYRYWESLKELGDRLRLLWASQDCGYS